MTHLAEPEVHQHRGTFRSRYALDKARDKKAREPRLMDLNTVVVLPGDSRYFDRIDDGEFCVVDVVNRQKGWFEWLPGVEVVDIHKTIEGHFGASAFRVGPRLWFV